MSHAVQRVVSRIALGHDTRQWRRNVPALQPAVGGSGAKLKRGGVALVEPMLVFDMSPAVSDAGADITLTLRLLPPPGWNVEGKTVTIRDADGAEIAKSAFVRREANAWVTNEIGVAAPVVVGEHRWKAAIDGEDPVVNAWATADASVLVRAQEATVSAWGLPSANSAGDSFNFMVGVRSSGACNLAGRLFRVLDHRGVEVAAGRLRDDVWRDTTAVYFAEVEATAPPTPGDYTWTLETPAVDCGIPQAGGSCALTVKVVAAADRQVCIEVTDSEQQKPISGIQVVMHPYRAVTDRHGLALLHVAEGQYMLSLSGFRYSPYRNQITVDKDVATRASLTIEPQNDGYPVD